MRKLKDLVYFGNENAKKLLKTEEKCCSENYYI